MRKKTDELKHIHKLPSGAFRVQIRLKGYDTFDKSFSTIEEACQARDRQLEVSKPKARGEKTLREVRDLYEDSAEFTDAPENTQITYKKRLAATIEALGNYALKALEKNPEILRSYFDKRRLTKKTRGAGRYSASTIRLEIAAVGQLISWAKERGYCTYNPAHEVKKPSPVRRERRVEEEERAKLKLARKTRDDLKKHTLFNIAIESLGCRPGELANAQRKDFNAEKREITFRNTKDKKKSRTVHVPPEALSAINEQLSLQDEDDPLIFSSRKNGKGEPVPYCWGSGITTLKRNLVVKKDYSAHVGRHEFITNAIEENVNTLAISKHVGHASVATTELYNHATTTSKTLRARIDEAEKNRDVYLAIEIFKQAGWPEEELEKMRKQAGCSSWITFEEMTKQKK